MTAIVRWPHLMLPCLLLTVMLMQTVRAQEFEGRRVALVIGNSDYKHLPLDNPVNDANAIEVALKKLKFEVTKHTNQNLRETLSSIGEITSSLKEGDLCLFFYAGHGTQVKGENYLIPIGAEVQDEADVPYECLPLDRVMQKFENSRCSFKVIVLDCCRDNPFSRSFSRGGNRGLNAVAAQPDGTIIAFSTKPGAVAADGSGKNSPYTESLIEVLDQRPESGLELIDVFRNTARAVAKKNGQRPFIRFDGAMQQIFLSAAKPGSVAVVPPTVVLKPQTFAETIGLKMVEIPAGRFMMGSKQSLQELFEEFPEEDGGNTFHQYSYPRHEVEISRPFELSAHEVTIGQFRAFVTDTGYQTEAERGVIASSSLPVADSDKMRWNSSRHFHVTDKYPVTVVSWNDAQAFCRWLGAKTGRTCRLPTQAEWEYACRAGSQTRYSFGDDPSIITHFANVPSASPTHPFSITWASPEGNQTLTGYSTDISRISVKAEGNELIYTDGDRLSAEPLGISEIRISNDTQQPILVGQQRVEPGQATNLTAETIDEPTSAYIQLQPIAGERWCFTGAYFGGQLFFYRDGNQWKSIKNHLSIPALADQNKLQVRNLDWNEPLQLKTQTGLVNVPPRQTMVVEGRPSVYWSPYEDGYPNQLAPVGQFEPNAFGIYDMHGNVWEWCQDGFDLDYSRQVRVDPKGSPFAEMYAIRGGCYL